MHCKISFTELAAQHHSTSHYKALKVLPRDIQPLIFLLSWQHRAIQYFLAYLSGWNHTSSFKYFSSTNTSSSAAAQNIFLCDDDLDYLWRSDEVQHICVCKSTKELSTTFHGNPTSSCWDITIGIKVADWSADRLTFRETATTKYKQQIRRLRLNQHSRRI